MLEEGAEMQWKEEREVYLMKSLVIKTEPLCVIELLILC